MDKKNKIGIIILVALIITIIIITIFQGKEKQETNQYLIISDYLIIQKDKENYKQINNFTQNVQSQKYTIYGDQIKNNLKLQYNNNQVYYFDENYKQQTVDNMRLATNIPINLVDYQIQPASQNDLTYIKKALKKENITYTEKYQTKKYIIDNQEIIYHTSNYVFDDVNYAMYSILFSIKNEKIQIIEKTKNSILDIEEIIDIDKDGKYELITSQDYNNIPTRDSCYKIYKLDQNKWINKKECKNQK